VRRENGLKVVFVSLFLAVSFLTGCAAPQWRFIVTGDSRSRGGDNGVNIAILSELAAEIAKRQVDFAVFSGDLVNGYVDQMALESQLNTWRNIMQPVYDAGIGVYVVRGNHDVGDPAGVTAWNNVFKDEFALPDNGPADEKNLTYSIMHKNAFIVAVDQYVRPRRVNQEWLDSQFASNTNPHIFVFGHEPAFKVLHKDCLDDYPADRDAFWAGIENAGGRTYFCGHDHFYNHARVDNDGDPGNDIHQYLVGTAGAPLYDWLGSYDGDNSNYTVEKIYHAKEYGYVLVEISALDATLTWMERTGAGKYKAKEVWSYTATPAPQLIAH
jgi:3',5'-cyclic AMP phosphodiesterase CpdA